MSTSLTAATLPGAIVALGSLLDPSAAHAQHSSRACPPQSTVTITEQGIPRPLACLFDDRGEVKAAIVEQAGGSPIPQVLIFTDSAPYRSLGTATHHRFPSVALDPGRAPRSFDELTASARARIQELVGPLPGGTGVAALPAQPSHSATEPETPMELAILARYEYDPLGRVRAKVGEEGYRHYVYDGDSNRVLAEYDAQGTAVVTYTWMGDRLHSVTRPGAGTLYPLFDGLGSVTGFMDSQGAIIARYQYDAWGTYRLHEQSLPDLDSHGFTGYRWEPNLDLYQANARFYDPEVGRFTSQDTYLGEINDPPSLHRYFYANDNPLRYVDPTGHAGSDAQARHFARPPEERLRITTTEKLIGEGVGGLASLAWDKLRGAHNLAVNTFGSVMYTYAGAESFRSQHESLRDVVPLPWNRHIGRSRLRKNSSPAFGRATSRAGNAIARPSKVATSRGRRPRRYRSSGRSLALG